MENKEFKLMLAKAIVERLWLKGHITEEQKKKIDERNKVKILSTNH